MKTLGAKIKALRILRNLTQEDMAHELDISLGAYSRIERDITDINLSRIEQIAKLFKMTVVQLMTYGEKSKDDEIEKWKKIAEEKDKEIMSLQKKIIKLMEQKK